MAHERGKQQGADRLQRLKRAALFLLFGLVLLIPKALGVLKRLRPGRPERSVDEQAGALGALVVLNGGRFRGVRARLFLTPDRLHVLDLEHRPLTEIPWAKVSSIRVEEEKAGKDRKPSCRLLVDWDQDRAEFHYEGFFARHLAEVAETTLRNELRRGLPVIG